MVIKSVKLHNFQIYKDLEIGLDKLNIVIGRNNDDPNNSSNGSGKTVFSRNALEFVFYGSLEGLTAKDLLREGEKGGFVEIDAENKGILYRIRRILPTGLEIWVNGEEYKANTIPLKQGFIDEVFGDLKQFKQFRTIDVSEGINLLDYCKDSRSIVTLKKTLMGFLEDYFTSLRQKLLKKKLDREQFNIDKKVYKFHLSDRRKKVLDEGQKSLVAQYQKAEDICRQLNKMINEMKSSIQFKKNTIERTEKELINLGENKCPLCGRGITKEEVVKMTDERINIIGQLNEEVSLTEEQLNRTQVDLEKATSILNFANQKSLKTKEFQMKLVEAMKFKDYKYTKKDVVVYNEAVKTIDTFAGVYIGEWLKNLEVIINNLLRNVNLAVKFLPTSDFLELQDNGASRRYMQLSAGQRIFLSATFKLALLLQKNLDGIIIIDEGISNLDKVNLLKFIEICKELPFQIVLTYQNIDKIDDVKLLLVERSKGHSTVKEL
jgi:DNA repair exonuclease SbcCD ATPase subunit